MAEIAGLKLIVPSSVAGSGVSVSASGKVTFTAADGDVSLNGVFNSTYDNYLIVGSGVSSGDIVVLYRLRASGSDASGANYTSQILDVTGSTVAGGRVSGTTNRAFVFRTTALNGFHLYMYGPALAQPTAHRSVAVNAGSGARIQDTSGTHSLSTAYDGISFQTGDATTLTGSLIVYGLSQ